MSADAREPDALTDVEYGIVREVAAEAAGRGRYGVEITLPGACDRCAVRGNCYGAGSLVWAASAEPLQPGDEVRLEMRSHTVLKATAWVYGTPLAGLLAGTIAGHQWLFASLSDEPRVLLSFGLGLALLAAAGYAMFRLNERVAQRLSITAYRDEQATGRQRNAAAGSASR